MGNIRTMNILLMFLTIIAIGHTGWSVWKDAETDKKQAELEYHLLNEPDPLTVERVKGDSRHSVCIDRNYEFRRLVKTKKSIDIYVQERWHSLDGDLNKGIIEGEIVLSQPIHYPLDAGFEKVMTFKKTVPATVGNGRWEYRPIATYVVNEKKRITRPLPVQLVDVDCDPPVTKEKK